jgi:hypothetical protein
LGKHAVYWARDKVSYDEIHRVVKVHGDELDQIKCIYIALLTSADISKCCTETQPKTPNSKQCMCRSTGASKNSLERLKLRKKPREEPGYEG